MTIVTCYTLDHNSWTQGLYECKLCTQLRTMVSGGVFLAKEKLYSLASVALTVLWQLPRLTITKLPTSYQHKYLYTKALESGLAVTTRAGFGDPTVCGLHSSCLSSKPAKVFIYRYLDFLYMSIYMWWI